MAHMLRLPRIMLILYLAPKLFNWLDNISGRTCKLLYAATSTGERYNAAFSTAEKGSQRLHEKGSCNCVNLTEFRIILYFKRACHIGRTLNEKALILGPINAIDTSSRINGQVKWQYSTTRRFSRVHIPLEENSIRTFNKTIFLPITSGQNVIPALAMNLTFVTSRKNKR